MSQDLFLFHSDFAPTKRTRKSGEGTDGGGVLSAREILRGGALPDSEPRRFTNKKGLMIKSGVTKEPKKESKKKIEKFINSQSKTREKGQPNTKGKSSSSSGSSRRRHNNKEDYLLETTKINALHAASSILQSICGAESVFMRKAKA
mmetsp:Transcript_15752/g.23975  ORF Transcript_15752/g.23975 Transcript_15752/m.23975 type:complete len:147 (-) Transcript_15752:315-755(-)